MKEDLFGINDIYIVKEIGLIILLRIIFKSDKLVFFFIIDFRNYIVVLRFGIYFYFCNLLVL